MQDKLYFIVKYIKLDHVSERHVKAMKFLQDHGYYDFGLLSKEKLISKLLELGDPIGKIDLCRQLNTWGKGLRVSMNALYECDPDEFCKDFNLKYYEDKVKTYYQ